MELGGIPLAQLVLMGAAMELRAERQAEADSGRPGDATRKRVAARKEQALARHADGLRGRLAARGAHTGAR